MQIVLTNTNPLPAGGVWVSPWQQTDPNYPFVIIEATSDQPGQAVIFEADQNDAPSAPISAHQVAALNVPAVPVPAIAGTLNPTNAVLAVQIRAAFYRIVYTNGSVQQVLFNFGLWSSTIPVPPTSQRQLDLILRELRAQTHLLLQLKEPGSLPPNLPMGFDLVQGDIVPAGLQPSPNTPPPPPQFT